MLSLLELRVFVMCTFGCILDKICMWTLCSCCLHIYKRHNIFSDTTFSHLRFILPRLLSTSNCACYRPSVVDVSPLNNDVLTIYKLVNERPSKIKKLKETSNEFVKP